VLRLLEILSDIAGADVEPELAPARLGELDRSCLAVARARDVLGWTARSSIEEGLRRTWEATPGP